MPAQQQKHPILSYLRAFLVVVIVYGLDLALDYWRSGQFGPVNRRAESGFWPLFQAGWLMGVLYFPLAAYFFCKDRQVNEFFSTKSVFKAVFVAWYGCIGTLGLLAEAVSSRWGALLSLGLLLGIVRSSRGSRLQRLVEYGSTCASLFVFCVVADEIPAHLWLPSFIGIALVQCLFLAGLQLAFAQVFSAEAPQFAD